MLPCLPTYLSTIHASRSLANNSVCFLGFNFCGVFIAHPCIGWWVSALVMSSGSRWRNRLWKCPRCFPCCWCSPRRCWVVFPRRLFFGVLKGFCWSGKKEVGEPSNGSGEGILWYTICSPLCALLPFSSRTRLWDLFISCLPARPPTYLPTRLCACVPTQMHGSMQVGPSLISMF